MYQFQNTATELRWKPFHKVSKWTYGWTILVVAITLGTVFFCDCLFETKATIIAVGTFLFLFSLYDIFLRTQHTIIFDKNQKKAYKKYAGLIKMPLFRFEDICLMNTSECAGNHYGISHRKNRYGKTYAISQDFTDEAEMIRFEQEILPEIDKILNHH